jgi:hypothetical protein
MSDVGVRVAWEYVLQWLAQKRGSGKGLGWVDTQDRPAQHGSAHRG